MPADLDALEDVINALIRLREAGAETGDGYVPLITKLDEFFWKRVEREIGKALSGAGEDLTFNPPQRLLIDAGLMDMKLVHRVSRGFMEQLSTELDSPGEANVFYLSEWLAESCRSFEVTRTLPDERVSESMLLKAAAREDAELGKARQQRNELYGRAAKLFKDLPGIKPDLSEAVIRGAVDDRIEELILTQGVESVPAGKKDAPEEETAGGRQAKNYDGVVRKMMSMARERTDDEEDLRYLETLETLRMAIFRKSLIHARRSRAGRPATSEITAGSQPDPEATIAEVKTFLHKELRLLRSLLRIGSREGKVAHACSVLLNDVPRTTKATVGDVLDLVREVDPRIGMTHNILIAPFTGSGFFEWDRNTLIVALSPARNSEEAAVNAVANFRLLTDARGGPGVLAGAYREMYGSGFREQFLTDYRHWVLRAGRGRREGIPEKSFKFLCENLGPPVNGPIVPHEMVRLSVGERNEQIKRLSAIVRAGAPKPEEVYHLAVMLWQGERIEDAIRNMEAAAKAMPDNGRVLYSLGLLCRKRRLTGGARRAFRDCSRVSSDTIWGLYAQEALRRMT